jgi:hypothetical protein
MARRLVVEESDSLRRLISSTKSMAAQPKTRVKGSAARTVTKPRPVNPIDAIQEEGLNVLLVRTGEVSSTAQRRVEKLSEKNQETVSTWNVTALLIAEPGNQANGAIK